MTSWTATPRSRPMWRRGKTRRCKPCSYCNVGGHKRVDNCKHKANKVHRCQDQVTEESLQFQTLQPKMSEDKTCTDFKVLRRQDQEQRGSLERHARLGYRSC
eukprot:GHVL01021991.1.p2 GENE.GHVL01021991.1~~GHVL01021991.1.p2  ORF type:complete len:102 (-),score=4.14 GHVL01021991.1:364-669(-)